MIIYYFLVILFVVNCLVYSFKWILQICSTNHGDWQPFLPFGMVELDVWCATVVAANVLSMNKVYVIHTHIQKKGDRVYTFFVLCS